MCTANHPAQRSHLPQRNLSMQTAMAMETSGGDREGDIGTTVAGTTMEKACVEWKHVVV